MIIIAIQLHSYEVIEPKYRVTDADIVGLSRAGSV